MNENESLELARLMVSIQLDQKDSMGNLIKWVESKKKEWQLESKVKENRYWQDRHGKIVKSESGQVYPNILIVDSNKRAIEKHEKRITELKGEAKKVGESIVDESE